MNLVFYITSAIAIISTVLAITRLNAVHALLYLIVSLLSVAIIFYAFGAPFIAALEIIIYAGAIMVLFVFVMMMLNLGERSVKQERQWLNPKMFIGPVILAAVLGAEIVFMLASDVQNAPGYEMIGPRAVGISLYSTYLLGLEIVGFLLLAGLVGAFHLGRQFKE